MLPSFCASHSDYFPTYSTTGNTCWAESGSVGVKLYTVTLVNTGNNHRLFVGSSPPCLIASGASKPFPSPYPTVTYIEIDGR